MNLSNYLQVIVTYIGAVIGAGFMSGQEILQFFVVYNQEGLVGTLVAGLLFIVLGISIILISYQLQVTDYYSLFYQIGGAKLGLVTDVWFSLFLFGSLVVMLAGCKEVFNYFFMADFNWGLLVTLVVVTAANFYGLDGVIKLNSILIPVLLIVSLAVIFSINPQFKIELTSLTWSKEWLSSVVVYVGYNLLLGLVVLLPLTTKIKQPELLLGVSTGGFSLGLLAFLIGFTLYSFYPKIVNSELPMLTILHSHNRLSYYLYGGVLWLAMVTTASCNLYGIANRCAVGLKLNKEHLIIIIIVITLPIIRLSFARLVELIYPWLGKVSLSLLSVSIIIYIGRRIWNGRETKY